MHPSEYERMFALEEQHWWYRALRELVVWHVRRAARAGSLRILDAGCGTGGMSLRLQPFGNVDGIDAAECAVGHCRQRGLTTVLCADLNTWEPVPAAYDVIVCLDVLYHQGIRDDAAVIRKFRAALKAGGMLIVQLPAFECLRRAHDVVVATKRRYTRSQARRLLSENGFEVQLCCYRLPWLFVAALFSKWYEGIYTAHSEARSDLEQMPQWLNGLLLALVRLENIFVRRGVSMPFGSSVFIVATPPNKATRL